MENDLKTSTCKLWEIMFIFERFILRFFTKRILSDRRLSVNMRRECSC